MGGQRKGRWTGMVTVAVLLSSLALTSNASTVEEIKGRGKLIVVSFPHSTSEFIREKADGGWEGLDFDIMTALAKKLGVDLEVHAVEGYGNLIPAMLAGSGDVVASSLTITDERRRQAQFCEPYFPVVLMVVAKQDSPIKSLEDLDGRVASVLRGSSQEQRLQAITGVEFHYVSESALHFDTILEGKADFALVDSTTALADLPQYSDLKVAFQLPDVFWYGYAVAEDSDLCAVLDSLVAKMRAGDYFYQLVMRYYGKQGVELLKLIEGETD